MIYLHTCEVHSHGSLKSSNCLIDSRWVVKIADYGLPHMRQVDEKTLLQEGEYAYYRRKSTFGLLMLFIRIKTSQFKCMERFMNYVFCLNWPSFIIDVGHFYFHPELLWKAPELLRDPNPPLAGTQKGDVYSFAIILYEIALRDGPYGSCELSPQGIIINIIQADVLPWQSSF